MMNHELEHEHAKPTEQAVHAAKGARWAHERSAQFVHNSDVDWKVFALAYPELAGEDPAAYVTRLEASLRFV